MRWGILLSTLLSLQLIMVPLSAQEPGAGKAEPPAEVDRSVVGLKNLRAIALGVHTFSDTHKGLPPAYVASADGKPNLSWRVLLLPYIGEKELYAQFHLDEPWNSDHNKELVSRMPGIYASPSGKAGEGKTIYLGVGGPEGVFLPPTENGVKWGRTLGFKDITDGTSNTLLVVEVADDSAVTWTQPDTEYQWKAADPFHDLPLDNFLAGRVDGSATKFTRVLKAEDWESLLNRRDGKVVSR